jgi:hypothetical protein
MPSNWWEWILCGFLFGFGWAAGTALFNGILSLFGRGGRTAP